MTAAPQSFQQTSAEPTRADFERIFQDACDEAGCTYDNEALLEAIASLKLQVKTYRDTNHVLRETLRVVREATIEALAVMARVKSIGVHAKHDMKNTYIVSLQFEGDDQPTIQQFEALKAAALSQAPVTDGASQPIFELMKLQARPAEGGDWVDIFPAQLSAMVKAGHDVRVLEVGRIA
jgi:hypothetical protein